MIPSDDPQICKTGSIMSMKQIITTFLFLSLSLFTSNNGFAQSEDDTLTVALDPVIVEAVHSAITLDEASMAISTLQRSNFDLASRPGGSLDEITFTMPGIWISNRENHALGERMTVRGMGWRSPFGVRGIQVILDDIPLTVADGQTILNMVDPAMVQNVELLRGPSASIWGNSSGGVLYLSTRSRPESPLFRYRTYYGSFETMKHEFRLDTAIQGLQLGAYGTWHRSDGYREHNRSELFRTGISAGMDVGSNSRIEFRAAYAGMPLAEHPGSLPDNVAREQPRSAWQPFVDADAGKQFDQLMGSATLYRQFNSGQLTLSSHGVWRDFHNPLTFAYIYVERLAGGSRLLYDFDELPFQLQVGAEHRWQHDDRIQTNNDGGIQGGQLLIDQLEKVQTLSAFSRAVIPVNSFNLNIGLRGDRMYFHANDRLGNESGDVQFYTLNPAVGLSHAFGDGQIFVQLSTSFESPTTTEFKNRPGGGTGFNKDLKPERTAGLEGGIRGTLAGESINYDLTLFGMNTEDQIVQFQEVQNGPDLYRNEGNSSHIGLESQFTLQPHSAISMDIMYTWIQARFRDGEWDGNHIPGVAPHRVASSISVEFGRHRLGLDAEWVGEFYTSSANDSHNDSYALLHSRWLFDAIEFEQGKVQPFLSIRNLLDVRYNSSVTINAFGERYFEPGSSRSLQAGITLQWY